MWDFGSGNTWNGYRYWMAMTPFPNSDGTYENPSILASADGNTWVVPDGLTNPIATAPSSVYADPDLLFDVDTLYCIWIHRHTGLNFGKIYLSSSTNGTTWTDPALIYETTPNLKGPALVKVGSTFYIYFSDNQSPMTIYRISCSTMTGTWGSLTACTYDPEGLQNSHVEALYNVTDNLYYMYLDNGQNFGISNDGINFLFNSDPMLQGTRYDWSQIMYRGSLVRTATGFDFWYSARSALGVWGIGRTTVTWSLP